MVRDPIPEGTTYVTGDNDNKTQPVTEAVWTINKLMGGQSKTLTLIVTPDRENFWLVNTANVESKVEIGSGQILTGTAGSLDEVINKAATREGMPVAALKAIMKVEAAKTFEYSEDEFKRFSTSGWWNGLQSEASRLADNHPDIVRGYAYNTCAYRNDCAPGSDVRGVTQFEIRTWNGIIEGLKFEDNHSPDRRNAADAIFGSAILNRQNAESYLGSKNITWNEDIIRAVARMYCAGPAAGKNPARARVSACGWNGRLGYDDFVWQNFLIFSGQTN